MPSSRYFLFILGIYLALAIGYSIVEPLGEAPDEADHFAYIRYISENRDLPEGPRITQGKHPPLYHAAVAALTAGIEQDTSFLRSNPAAFPSDPDASPNFFIHTTLEAFPWRGAALAMHLGRFLSIVLGAVTLWATWRIGVETFPNSPEIGLLAAAFLAALPAYLFISASINNDNAAGTFGALVLLLNIQMARRGLSLFRTVLLGILLGFGLLSKVGTLALWPLVALAAAAAIWPERAEGRAWSKAGAYVLLAWLIAVIIASPWLMRNTLLYGDPLGWKLVDATIDMRDGPVDGAVLLWLFQGLFEYFWGRFGAIGQIRMPEWFYVFAAVTGFALLAGAIFYVLKNHKQQSRFLILLLALAPMLVLASIVRYTAIALGTDQARLMWPAIGTVAVWVGIGVAGLSEWSGLSKRIRARNLVAGFVALMMIYGVSILTLVVYPAFAPPPTARAASEKPLSTFGEHFELLDVQLPDQPLSVGEPVDLKLFWRANATITDDLRPVVRLYHIDGWLAAEWDHSPAQGRYATDRWHPGEVVSDPYPPHLVPVSPGIYRVEVGVRPFRGDWLPIEGNPEITFFELGEIEIR
jgi:hypothetical protein